MISPVVATGCGGGHTYYRAYDPYYHDYHRWDPDEDRYYHRWAVENRHEDRDFRHLGRDDQKRYWNWRHDHRSDHDHDHDNDRH